MYDPLMLAQIRSAVGLVDFVSKTVELKAQGRDFFGLCPFHQENTPSFSITPEKGLFYCHGCGVGGDIFSFVRQKHELSFSEAVEMLAIEGGIELDSAPQPAEYIYLNADGKNHLKVNRYYKNEKKCFAQYHWNGTRWVPNSKGIDKILYRLPEVLSSELVLIVEGEKDCHAARDFGLETQLGAIATTSPGGAERWVLGAGERWLKGRRVVIIPDCDAAGERHCRQVLGDVPWAKVLKLPQGKDLTEYLCGRGTIEELMQLIKGVLFPAENTASKGERLKIMSRIRDIESENGFLTSAYFWELETLADEIKRSSKWLQGIYGRYLSESTNSKDQTFHELCEKCPEDVPWLISDTLYRGSTTLFHAAGGCGKTLLTYNLIKSLSLGNDFLGIPVAEKVRCGLIQVDEPERAFIERAKEMGLDQTDNLIILDWSFGLVSSLDKWIEDNNLGLVIIDSFFAAQKFAETRENDADHAAILMRLRDIAQRTNAAIVIVHHSNKNGGARGSSAITGAVSEVWHLTAPDPEKHGQYKLRPSERIFECEKTRMVSPFKIALEMEPESFSWRNLGDLRKIDDGTVDEPASWTDRIKIYIEASAKAFTISDLTSDRTMLGLERDTAKKILNRLKKKGFVFAEEQSFGKSETTWTPPRFRTQKTCHGVTVDLQSKTEPDFTTVTSTVTSAVTTGTEGESVTVVEASVTTGTEIPCHGSVTDTVTVVESLSGEALGSNRDTVTGKSDIFSRIKSEKIEKERKPSPHKPSRPYAGPKEGAIVLFSDQGMSVNAHKKMKEQGVAYPWGAIGTVTSIVKGTNRHEIIVTVGSETYLVDNFLAIEVLESPGEFDGVVSSDNVFDSVEFQGNIDL